MLEFGTCVDGRVYRPRPGSYAVLLDDRGRIAVLRTPKGFFLPGGGADPGESPETTVRREVLEESGHEIAIEHALGRAIEYVDAGTEGCFAKECSFFQGLQAPVGTSRTFLGGSVPQQTPPGRPPPSRWRPRSARGTVSGAGCPMA